jgi:hypothetical protein
MPFNRIFYATQGVALKGQNVDGTSVASNWYYPRGLQSIGITTNFTLEQVFQLGQIELYDNMENVPEVEVTMSKIIDGTFPLYLLCTCGQNAASFASGKEIVALANNRVNVRLGLYSDDLAAATGTPTNYVDCSGMYLSSVSYTIPVEGNATEDITLVGNNKVWNSGLNGAPNSAGIFDANAGGGAALPGTMTAPSIARRYKYNTAESIIPTGLGGGIPAPGGGKPRMQSVTISANLGREAIFELGAMAPYYRYVTFPLEVTSEFQIIAASGDMVQASDFSNLTSSCATEYKNLQDKEVNIVICGSGTGNSLRLDLGKKNKLTSVNYAGGDTGGGNATVTYSYQTFNKLVVTGSGSFIDTSWVDNGTDSNVGD